MKCVKLILILIVLIALNLQSILVAQEPGAAMWIIPKSPSAALFDKFIDSPAVSGTGVPEISIPFYDLEYKGFYLPISISYHASGVKVDDIATPVGLNWALNAGGEVTRTVYGRPDELSVVGLFTFDSLVAETSCNPSDLRDYYEGWKDVAPDVFSYNLPHINGKFMFRRDSSILISGENYLKIISDFDYSGSELNFSIYDEKGILYSFLPLELTRKELMDDNAENYLCFDYSSGTLTGWKLDKIIFPTGEQISFTYERYKFDTDYYWTSSNYSVLGPNYCLFQESDLISYQTYTEFESYLVKTITTPKEKVEFTYATDTQLSCMKRVLESVTITSEIDNDTIKIVKLNHDKYSGDPRLKLTSIDFYGNSELGIKHSYKLSYESSSLPEMGSKGQDIFGYQNENTRNHMIPFDSSYGSIFPSSLGDPADREVSLTYIKRGVLNEIEFPTGGKVQYSFEANKDDTLYAPGLRVKQIKYLTENNETAKNISYEYGMLGGDYHIYGNYINHYETKDKNAYIPSRTRDEQKWTSNPISNKEINNGFRSGFYYKSVTTKTLVDTIVYHSIVDYYNGYTDIFSISPYLKKRDFINKNEEVVKREIFDHSFNLQTNSGWSPSDSYLTGAYICNGTEYVTLECDPTIFRQPLDRYTLYANRKHLDKNTNIEYYDGGADSIITSKEYTYNNFSQPSQVITLLSNSTEKIDKIHYADDYDLSGYNWLDSMKSSQNHIISSPIDYREYYKIDQQLFLVSGKTITYNDTGQQLEEYVWRSSTPSSASAWSSDTLIGYNFIKETSMIYDTISNNIVQKTEAIGNTAFIWGYDNCYPIAVIKGGDFENSAYTGFETPNSLGGWQKETGTITTAESKTGKYSCYSGEIKRQITEKSTVTLWVKNATPVIVGNSTLVDTTRLSNNWTYYVWNVDPGQITITATGGYIDDPRVFEDGAEMITYTYDPSIGVTSVSDVNGKAIYYEYEKEGRLEYIIDNDRKILKQNIYNYKK